MPNVTATPKGMINGVVVTEFTDTTSTTSVTYTYPTQQTSLVIENSGVADIFVTVGSYSNQVIKPDKKWRADVPFTSFSIRSDANSQEFIATASIEIADDLASVTAQLVQKAAKEEVRLKTVKLEPEDLSENTLGLVTGTGTVNLLSIPQDLSVTPKKTTFIKTGKNKVNNANNIVGERISTSTGAVVADSTRSRTEEYIEVDEYTTYTLSIYRNTDLVNVTTEFDIVFYDNAKNFLSGYRAFSESGHVFTPPAGTKFVRLVMKSLTRLMQLETGSASSAYEDFYTDFNNPKKVKLNITSDQRTVLGEMARGYSATPVVVSKANRTVTITGQFVLYYRNIRIVAKLSSDPDVVLQLPTAPPSSMSDYIFYDIKNNNFILSSGGALQTSVNEDCVMVMNVIIDSNGEMTVIANLNYVIEGTKTSANIYFAPEDLVGQYECLQSGSDFNIDPAVTSVASFQGAWNNLVAPHSDYVTSEIMGKDATGVYDVYRYKFKPTRPYLYLANKQLPTILLIVGIHGEEKAAMFSAYYFFKDLLEEWDQNPLIEYLRFNVNIELIPCANPYGFQNNTRSNGNAVDINRNWEYNFEPISTGGAAPFSEIETQYIKRVIDENPSAIYYVDFHDTMLSSGTNYPDTIVHVISTKSVDQDITMSTYYHISKMTRMFYAKYDQGNGLEYFGRSGSNAYAISPSYALQKSIPASLLEGFSKFPSEPAYYSANTIKANAESLGNWLLSIIKLYKNKQ